MSQTMQTVKERFEEQFKTTSDIPHTLSTQTQGDALSTIDETIMWCDANVTWVGPIEFDNYEENTGWSMGYAQIDGEPTAVYIYESNRGRVSIDADKLDNVAKVLRRTPADIAESVRLYRNYPPVIEVDNGEHIIIAPILGEEITLENE